MATTLMILSTTTYDDRSLPRRNGGRAISALSLACLPASLSLTCMYSFLVKLELPPFAGIGGGGGRMAV